MGADGRLSDVASSAYGGYEPRSGEVGTYLRGLLTGGWNGASDSLLEMRALSEGSTGAGGHLVPTPLASFVLDLARNKTRVVQAGAVTIPMDSDTLKVPAVASAPVPSWRNEGALVTEADPTFEVRVFNSQTLAVLVKASIELLADAPGMAALLEQTLANAFALELDRTALFGTGAAPQPLGLFNTTVEKVAAGVNGAAPTYDMVIDRVAAVQARNFEPSAIIAHGRSLTALAKSKDSAGNYLAPPAVLDGIPRLDTGQVPTNQTVGASGAVASSIFVGDWQHLAIGLRTSFRVLPLKERFMDSGLVGFVAYLRADIQTLRPEAFSVLTGAL